MEEALRVPTCAHAIIGPIVVPLASLDMSLRGAVVALLPLLAGLHETVGGAGAGRACADLSWLLRWCATGGYPRARAASESVFALPALFGLRLWLA